MTDDATIEAWIARTLSRLEISWVVPLLIFGVVSLFIYAWFPPVIFSPLQFTIPAEAMKISISVVLLGASVYVILSTKYGPKDKHWAYGTVGTLLGFWLRP